MESALSLKDSFNITGIVTLYSWPAGAVAYLNHLISQGVSGEIIRKIIRTKGKLEMRKENTVMRSANHGKDIICQRLIGTNTYSGNITYGEIGTGSTTPAITDTALTTPTARTTLASGSIITNHFAICQFFFADAVLANQTYKEFGSFIDGTATIGTGQLFNHALFSPTYTKSAGTDITVEVDINLA